MISCIKKTLRQMNVSVFSIFYETYFSALSSTGVFFHLVKSTYLHIMGFRLD